MLSGVASLLFGSSPVETPDVSSECELPTRDGEQGWVVVDLPSSDLRESEQQQQQHANLRVPVEIPEGDSSCPSDPESTGSQNLSTPESLSPSGRSHFSYRTNIDATESWILTPPPCFTAKRKRNSQVEDSPMENLLIEHPSMSVYNSHGRSDSTGDNSNQSESSSEVEMDTQAADDVIARRTRQQLAHQPPRRAHAVAARAGIVAQIQTVKIAQRHQQYQSTRKFNRKCMDKGNKVREYQSLGKRQKQRSRIQHPSGCMNGRVGQRKF